MRLAVLALPIFIALIALARMSYGAGKNYWIDESTDFTGNGCENSNLNNVTSSLRNRLESDGWSGTRWSNQNAWPEDFIEQNLGGIDHVAGDSQTLSVYAGHGNRALIQFGYQRNGRCTVSFPPSTRLGRQGSPRSDRPECRCGRADRHATPHAAFFVDPRRHRREPYRAVGPHDWQRRYEDAYE